MVHYSVVIPQRNCDKCVRELVQELESAFVPLALPYEIICVDDASQPQSSSALQALSSERSCMRVLRFEEPRGTSAALTAGIAAARGDLVIALGTSENASPRHLASLIAELSRCDLATAVPERSPGGALRSAWTRLYRAVVRRPDLLDDETLYWVAPRRAVAGLALSRGAFRLVEELLVRRGCQVRRLTIRTGLPVQSRHFRASLVGRLAAHWLDRSFEPHLASEQRTQLGMPWPAIATRLASLRHAPTATTAVSEIKSHDAH